MLRRARRRAVERPVLPVALLLAVPFVVAVVVLHSPQWHADHDFALTELRVRDVFTSDPPLVGLSGRIEHDGVGGSHPGPMIFWLVAPVYWVLGRSSWALQAATAAVNLAAVVMVLWIATRRAGRWGLLSAAAGLAVLMHAYGPERWTTPWIPFIPALWWPVMLLAAWSVLAGDHKMIVVVAIAGSLCAQTHVSYVGLVAALGALAMAAVVVRIVAARQDPVSRRQLVRWTAVSGAVAALVWLPPLADQVANDPGNLSILAGQFMHPSDGSVGLSRGLELWLAALDPTTLVSGPTLDGSAPLGALALTIWGISAFATWRRGPRDVLHMHAVVAVALGAGLISVSSIQGRAFDYLLLWSWGTLVFMIAATVATAAAVGRNRVAGGYAAPGVRRAGSVALAGTLAAALVATTSDAARVPPPLEDRAALHAELLPATARALTDGSVAGTGTDDRYLVRADDQFLGGFDTYTLLLYLERRGLDAGVDAVHARMARPHRVLGPTEATAVLTYVTGDAIEAWRDRPDAVELAHVEPPGIHESDTDNTEQLVRSELRRSGLDDLAASWNGSILGLVVDTRIPDATLQRINDQLAASVHPTSVFLSPPE